MARFTPCFFYALTLSELPRIYLISNWVNKANRATPTALSASYLGQPCLLSSSKPIACARLVPVYDVVVPVIDDACWEGEVFMESAIGRIRRPVKREGAERYLMFTLVSFAASVILMRLFLELSGYPQVGGGELHIAHVLWGGMLLFVASLLPLLFANHWVFTAGALLAGIGIGLFIDEVGKFITQHNDYFYPAAAPIIYAFFLLTVLLYLQVRRPRPRDARAELYRALESFEVILDHDLNP